ncbi:MAG TPA: DUF5666 domain-containing protein [Candidatus Angelobacter sp.]|nr:DUF5666 domain-containing protein [Candidatus Angelobacter sp.]
MKRYLLLTVVTVALILATGCGGKGNLTIAGPTNATINTTDGLNDQIVKFELSVSSLTLTGSGTTTTTGNLLSKTSEVEFVHQAGSFEPLALVNIPPGTYSGASLTVANPEVVVMNNAVPPAPVKITATLASPSVTVTFTAPITVTSSNSSVINFDLDLASSVVLSGTPPTSATVTPKFNVTTATANNSDGDSGEMDDVHGSVTAIAAPNFTIQTKTSSIVFATDASTQFKDGITSLSQLKVGDIVEVDGTTKPDGSKLASKVEVESSQSGKEAEGVITVVTGTPATQITIAHQVDSSSSTTPPVTLDVAISATTKFSVRTDKLNLGGAAPAFDAGHIGKGQRVEADSGNSTATPIVADKLKLREQALVGTVSAASASGFTLTLNASSAFATLTGQSTVAVSTVSGTNLKVTPANTNTVRVRGLIFFNAGAYSMIAARVDDNK